MQTAGTYDVIIVGAGIVALATAHEIRKMFPGARIAILEKETSVGTHQSSRNSGVIHSGVYYQPGSQKAVNCIRGYRMLLDYAEAHNIPYDLCGKVIVAQTGQELGVLKIIHKRGLENGLDGCVWLDQQEVKSREPHVRAVAGVWVPQAGIIDYGQVCDDLAQQAQTGGADLYLGQQVTAIQRANDHIRTRSTGGTIKGRLLINCAGLYADKVARMTGMTGKFKIMAFRGEFYEVSSTKAQMIHHLVYPVPDLRFPFLGVHLTQRLDGSLEAGPNAVLAFRREGYHFRDINLAEFGEVAAYGGFWRMASQYWRKGIDEMHRSISTRAFFRELRKLFPALGLSDIKRTRSGVRAQCVASDGSLIYDYAILEDHQVINVCNAPSPAATSCFSIGQFLATKALDKLR